ncbi:MAG: hypothetical protein ABSB42_11980 [Tepidisphaeraceae bacterium]
MAVLATAVNAILSEYNDFWVLSALTDRSYEEGDRNAEFRAEIEHYESAGIPESLVGQLRKGINGNLAEILETQNVGIGQVLRNKGRGQDLIFGPWERGGVAMVEIKLVFDCTVAKYFPSVAADWIKLSMVRADQFDGDLFLVVFFATLPNYTYPAGSWFGVSGSSRDKYLRNCGIEDQLHKLRRFLHHVPCWPENGSPRAQTLRPLASEVSQGLADLYRQNFRTSAAGGWSFQAPTHLRDGAVGVAIWEVR